MITFVKLKLVITTPLFVLSKISVIDLTEHGMGKVTHNLRLIIVIIIIVNP
jgi:hypothetical protein